MTSMMFSQLVRQSTHRDLKIPTYTSCAFIRDRIKNPLHRVPSLKPPTTALRQRRVKNPPGSHLAACSCVSCAVNDTHTHTHSYQMCVCAARRRRWRTHKRRARTRATRTYPSNMITLFYYVCCTCFARARTCARGKHSAFTRKQS